MKLLRLYRCDGIEIEGKSRKTLVASPENELAIIAIGFESWGDDNYDDLAAVKINDVILGNVRILGSDMPDNLDSKHYFHHEEMKKSIYANKLYLTNPLPWRPGYHLSFDLTNNSDKTISICPTLVVYKMN